MNMGPFAGRERLLAVHVLGRQVHECGAGLGAHGVQLKNMIIHKYREWFLLNLAILQIVWAMLTRDFFPTPGGPASNMDFTYAPREWMAGEPDDMQVG